MRTLVDNHLLQKLLAADGEYECQALLDACIKDGIIGVDEEHQISFGWPSLLEYVGLGDIFKKIPKFDDSNPLFISLVLAVIENPRQEELNEIFDQIFVECLVNVKDLPNMHPTLLLERLIEKRQNNSHPFIEKFFSRTLDMYEKRLDENPSDAGHDLILHLAWDRVCNNYATFFDDLIPTPENQKSLSMLRECLTESFHHITEKARTVPGFFRLTEALYLNFLKSEKTFTKEEFEKFSSYKPSNILKSDDELTDVFYIDTGSIGVHNVMKESPSRQGVRVFTFDSPEVVNQRLSLANEIIDQLTKEFPGWYLTLSPSEIVCLKEEGDEFVVEVILTNPKY